MEALRFVTVAVAVPALLALGAPWRFLGLGSARLFDRLARSRSRHLDFGRSIAWLVVYMALVMVWRTPPAVNGVARHPWLLALEAVSLIGAGVALWLELAASPPVVPRIPPPRRIAVAAFAMWTLWASAYVVGLASGSVYAAYRATATRHMSPEADQAIATFVIWFVAGAAFVPLIFWNLMTWLASDDDPDQGLHRLVREARRRSFGSTNA